MTKDKKSGLTGALLSAKTNRVILDKVTASRDETLGPGKFWRSASYMRRVDFDDLMDILLYYLSLQPDLGIFAAGIEASNFLWITVKDHWQKRASELFPFIETSPWANGSGPMGGSAGDAESYSLRVGLFDQTLLTWFLFPEVLEGEKEKNWPKHKKRIEKMLFPKLRRKYNAKKLDAALIFVGEICDTMRREARQETAKL